MTDLTIRPVRLRSIRRLSVGALLWVHLAACGGEPQVVAVQFTSFSGATGTWVGSEYNLARGASFATGTYAVFSDGSTEPVVAEWTETQPSIVSVAPSATNNYASVTAVAPGSTIVSASYRGVRGDIAVRVY